MWDDSKHIAFDFETSGVLPEYALQPWRVANGTAWATSIATAHKTENSLVTYGSLLVGAASKDARSVIATILHGAIQTGQTLVGWNVAFDISWLLAYGFEAEVRQIKFLDGMLLWRHWMVEPEYDTTRHKKKSYSLKQAVREELPRFAGYEDDIDFHSTEPYDLSRLHAYNERDTLFTLRLTRTYYNKLAENPQRLKAALIEADCLVDVAKANLLGMCVDVPTTKLLGEKLVNVAGDMLARLAPHGVTEKVVRSPKQLATLMFDTWGLPKLKQNMSQLTGNVTDSTDKEVLHELSFLDPRAAEIRLYREALGNKTKFVDTPLKAVEYNSDGKAHPIAMVFGTYCVPGDVEVLTREGWCRLDLWQGGEIAQVHPDLSIEFLTASRFVGPVTDTWVHMRQRSFDCMFTPGHTVAYLKQKTFQWATTHAGQMVGSGEAKYIPVAGRVTLTGQYTPDQMRLFAAVQADGCSTEKELKFMFKKVRKIERLRQLLRACGIVHREYVCAAYPERVEFHIPKRSRPRWLGHDKKQFGGWLLDTTYEGLVAFVDELVHWDGSPHADGGVRYVSQTEENVIWVTTAAALVGRKASKHILKVDLYSCHISLPTTRACKTIKPARDVTEVTQPARAYCATTQTGFWLARSNGHIFVTGNTSRMTYASKQGRNKDERQTGFALHQMKRGRDFRSIIVPPEGYTLMEFDAAGQEFRWMAIASGDETMLALCEPGEDPHGYMGAQIQHEEYKALIQRVHEGDKTAKDVRQLGKVANLSLQYRTSAKKLRVVARVQYNMNMELSEAAKIHATYQNTYRKVPEYWRNQIALTKRLGYVETFAGRRVQIAGNWAGTQGWSMESTSINYRIQCTGGDQKYLALSVLKPYIAKIGAIFAWELHDGVYLYVPHAQVERAATEIPWLLANLPYQKAWGFTPPIPLPWDCKFGPSWGELEEWK
jgi:DNA polymerase I-like protein with 3'-5' exonuclease and polymerase domains